MGIKERFYIMNLMYTWGLFAITETSKAVRFIKETFNFSLSLICTSYINPFQTWSRIFIGINFKIPAISKTFFILGLTFIIFIVLRNRRKAVVIRRIIEAEAHPVPSLISA